MKPTSLIKSGLWITYATFVTRIFVFLSSLVLARLLQPADFGVIGIAYVFWSFFTLFTQDTAGTFIVYKGADNPKYVNTTYTISLLIGLGLAVAMIVAAPFVAHFFNEPALTGILIVFSFNLLLSSATYVYSGIMTRRMQYQTLANISLANSITRLLFTTGAALLGLGYWSFVIGDTASCLVNCLLTWCYAKYPFRLQIDPGVRSEVLTFCLGAVGSSFGLYLSFNADNFAVGKILGSASLGYYNLAYQLSMTLSGILSSLLNQLGMPVFAQLPIDKQENALFKVVEQIAFIAAPIYALIFLVLDPQVVTLLFGAKWIAICTVLPGLLFYAYFRVVNSPLYSMLVAKGRPDVNARVSLQIAPIAIASFVIGAYQGGIVGVSLAVALVLGICWTIYYWWTACTQLHWSLKKFLLPCFIPVLLSIPGIALSLPLPLLLKPFTFLLIYLCCIRVLIPQQFFQYQTFLSKLVDRVLAFRPGR
ncbi:MAG: lipopolysaccharide biosynthesis protein [Plectolyngbya sp. WJT66-NPBG17]|jgi:O-antigen/teichoic acid export membrane protein|nr:lipopolysaccharide biosynthesis protein [Plectolyngbya sp. WJT66-NPBG17]MBW4526556.1 lipopolysaccharide biosynthesis protein [Phormidium tanganyikae FI6-MK23]